MSDRITSWISLIAVAAWVGVSCPGCSRQPKDAILDQKIEAASSLPGATNVIAALDRKDYEGAISALVTVKESVTQEQLVEYAILTSNVKVRLMEAAPSDPKAAEALNVLRSLSTGR